MFSSTEMTRRNTHFMAELDKDIIDRLHKVGFRTNLGYDGTGFLPIAMDKCGGYYFGMLPTQIILIIHDFIFQILEQAK